MEIEGIVLVRPKLPVNVGSIARVMAAFGVEELIIVSDKENFEKIVKKSRGIAKGGAYIIDNAKLVSSLSEIKGKKIGTISIYDNKKYGFKLVPITDLPKIEGKYYLVFGNEGYGLSKEELELCDIISTIPTNDKYGILNLGISATLYIYEIYKHRFINLLNELNKIPNINYSYKY